jgi:CRISPR-associated protein Cmr6
MTWLPSHKAVREAPPRTGNLTESHAGLVWAKFFDHWSEPGSEDWPKPPDPGEGATGGKREWINHFTTNEPGAPSKPVGDAGLLAEYLRRRHALAAALGGESRRFRLRSGLVTGVGIEHPVENGFLFHPTLGVPYLPASGVKGLVRAWATHVLGAPGNEVARICGKLPTDGSPDAGVGTVVFMDLLPTAPVRLAAEVVTPHVGDWLVTVSPEASPPGDWIDPTPIPFLVIPAGKDTPCFEAALLPNSRPPHDRPTTAKALVLAWKWLEDALDWLGAGARTSAGYGRLDKVKGAT